jgi:hypothetical protein
MPTGLTSAWGYPPFSVAGYKKTMEFGDTPLTYQFGLSSIPPSFPNGKFQSPLTPIAIRNISAFGKSKKLSKSICKQFLKNKSINPVTGRKIKRSGKTFKNLMNECDRNGLLKKKL